MYKLLLLFSKFKNLLCQPKRFEIFSSLKVYTNGYTFLHTKNRLHPTHIKQGPARVTTQLYHELHLAGYDSDSGEGGKGAPTESSTADGGQGRGEAQVGEGRAILEGTVADDGEGGRQNVLLTSLTERTAVREGANADGG